MDKKSTLVALSLVVVVLALGLWFANLQRGVPSATVDTAPVRSTSTPAGAPPSASTAASLSQEAATLDLGDLDAEFQAVDSDLEQL
jgi:hypothetical protein